MARHQYPEAAKTAIIVASEEQINGIVFNTRLLSVYLSVCIICMTSEVLDSTSAIHCIMYVAAEMDHYRASFNSLKSLKLVSRQWRVIFRVCWWHCCD
jgi:hypothetical protein